MRNFYITTIAFIKKNKNREQFFYSICKVLPYIVAISYIGLLATLFYYHDLHLWSCIFKPACVFVLVTIFRMIINRPRPFVTLHFYPLFSHKEGQSFPSRHSASALIIALMMYSIYPNLGSILFIIAILIGISRVLSGVHYPSDVFVAFFISIFIFYV